MFSAEPALGHAVLLYVQLNQLKSFLEKLLYFVPVLLSAKVLHLTTLNHFILFYLFLPTPGEGFPPQPHRIAV